MTDIVQFEVGKLYAGYVTICGYAKKLCTVTKRTPSFVFFTDGKYSLKGKVSIEGNQEVVRNREISITAQDLFDSFDDFWDKQGV